MARKCGEVEALVCFIMLGKKLEEKNEKYWNFISELNMRCHVRVNE